MLHIVQILLLQTSIYASVCPPSLGTCGSACYHADEFNCFSKTSKVLCSINDKLCGASTCFNPKLYRCIDGIIQGGGEEEKKIIAETFEIEKAPCQPPMLTCGKIDSCYSPLEYQCFETVKQILCLKSMEICDEACYSKTEYECFDEVLCTKGDLLCGQKTCYDPKLYHCVSGAILQN